MHSADAFHRSTGVFSMSRKIPASITDTMAELTELARNVLHDWIQRYWTKWQQAPSTHTLLCVCVFHDQQTRIHVATHAFLWKWMVDFSYWKQFSCLFSQSLSVSLLQPSVHHGHASVDLDHCRGPWLTDSTLFLCWQPTITTNIRR